MRFSDKFVVFLAQGFGVGRIPFAPGTWGSVLGVGFFYSVLLTTSHPWLMLFVPLLGVFLAVWVCGTAARILGEEDPSSVVLDEIVAVPLCFFALVISSPGKGANGAFARFVSEHELLTVIVIFSLFRLFDIWKPWPIRQSQRLPGGWGIVMDDVLAAVYVNLVMLIAMLALR